MKGLTASRQNGCHRQHGKQRDPGTCTMASHTPACTGAAKDAKHTLLNQKALHKEPSHGMVHQNTSTVKLCSLQAQPTRRDAAAVRQAVPDGGSLAASQPYSPGTRSVSSKPNPSGSCKTSKYPPVWWYSCCSSWWVAPAAHTGTCWSDAVEVSSMACKSE